MKRYLWMRPNSTEDPLVLIDDPVELFRGNKFDEETDKLYRLGEEVKLEVTIKPVGTTYRGATHRVSGYFYDDDFSKNKD